MDTLSRGQHKRQGKQLEQRSWGSARQVCLSPETQWWQRARARQGEMGSGRWGASSRRASRAMVRTVAFTVCDMQGYCMFWKS